MVLLLIHQVHYTSLLTFLQLHFYLFSSIANVESNLNFLSWKGKTLDLVRGFSRYLLCDYINEQLDLMV